MEERTPPGKSRLPPLQSYDIDEKYIPPALLKSSFNHKEAQKAQITSAIF
jgi:hypothetical protein